MTLQLELNCRTFVWLLLPSAYSQHMACVDAIVIFVRCVYACTCLTVQYLQAMMRYVILDMSVTI